MEGPIKQFMSTSVISISKEIDFLEACRKFSKHGIHHLPVVEEGDKLIGMFSATDAINAISKIKQQDELTEDSINSLIKVIDVMTSRGIEFLEPEDSIGEAILQLQLADFNSIPILENEKLVGIITSFDLFKAFRKQLNKKL